MILSSLSSSSSSKMFQIQYRYVYTFVQTRKIRTKIPAAFFRISKRGNQKIERRWFAEKKKNSSYGEIPKNSGIVTNETKQQHVQEGEEDDEDMVEMFNDETGEWNGPRGLEPTRYGDWESKGRCWDF